MGLAERTAQINVVHEKVIEMQNSMALFSWLFIAFIICIYLCSLYFELKKIRLAQYSNENFIFKSSIVIGIYTLVSLELLVVFLMNPTYKEFVDLSLKLMTLTMGGVALMVAYLNFQRKDGVEFQLILDKVHITENQGSKFLKLRALNLKDRPLIVQRIVIQLDNISIIFPLVDIELVENYKIKSLSSDHIKYFRYRTIDEFSSSNPGYIMAQKTRLVDWRVAERMTMDNLYPQCKNQFIFERIKNFDCVIEVETTQGNYLLSPDENKQLFVIKNKITELGFQEHILTIISYKSWDSNYSDIDKEFVHFHHKDDKYRLK